MATTLFGAILRGSKNGGFLFHLQMRNGLGHLIGILPLSQSVLPKPTLGKHINRTICSGFTLEFAPLLCRQSSGFCSAAECDVKTVLAPSTGLATKSKNKKARLKSRVDFTKIDPSLLPTVIIVGRPNVGKSALFNRLIRRREALVYNTPDDHVTRDIREGIAKLGDLRFKVLDSAGLETEATSGTILSRTTEMTGNVLARTQVAIFLIDDPTERLFARYSPVFNSVTPLFKPLFFLAGAKVEKEVYFGSAMKKRAKWSSNGDKVPHFGVLLDGLQPLDLEVGKWMRKHASNIHTIVAMNKSESLDERGLVTAAAGEAHSLGFGDPIAISAETGLGMAELYETLRPLLEDYALQLPSDLKCEENASVEVSENSESKVPLQLAIVGRPNVGKSTLLNTLLQEERVLVGPESGLTRDSIRAKFQFEDRTIYLVDTAGWLHRSGQEKGPSSLSIVQTRKNLMRAHVVALVLDGEEIARKKSSMKHDEVIIARQAVEEGRALVVIVNKMDLLIGKQNSMLYEKVLKVVPEEIQTLIPQITGIPVLFISALEGRGRIEVMRQVVDAYQKWCSRLSTARLNRWLRKVMSRHSWKDKATQPKIKYFTQVKARPPTFVAFLTGKAELSDTDIRFLIKSLKEDFNLGGIPIRIVQRSIPRKTSANSSINNNKNSSSKVHIKLKSD